jgi:chaperonin GroES
VARSKKKQKKSIGIGNRGGSVGSKAKGTKAKSALKAKLKTKNRTETAADAVAGARAFKPIEDRVLIAVQEASETTAGGIIIPGNVESRPSQGTVLAKGPGRRGKKGQIRPLDVNVGDLVLFPEYAGSKIQIAGDDFLILREDELLGIVTA